jgi:hypothetical protein
MGRPGVAAGCADAGCHPQRSASKMATGKTSRRKTSRKNRAFEKIRMRLPMRGQIRGKRAPVVASEPGNVISGEMT